MASGIFGHDHYLERAPNNEQANTTAMRIVGIGASAGGLAALQTFFSHVPSDSGMAFIVILHLSMEQDSHLAEVLQRSTSLPVTQAHELVQIAPNHVYVIPPGKDLVLKDGWLNLSEAERPYGRRVQIDLFFRSLAESHGPDAAAVVLSGSGSDGASGLQRVKEMGGVTLVQSLQEAQYDSMPRNAMLMGLADFVLPAAEMPGQLVEYWNNADQIRLLDGERDATTQKLDEALAEISRLIRLRTGHDFAEYKRATMLRRIARRMHVHGVKDIAGYVAVLRGQAGEVQALLRDLLISVTNFFRDTEAWAALEALVPRLFADKSAADQVRVWVAGCATGEEPYSIAILLREYAATLAYTPQMQVFATDIDQDALATARAGLYLDSIEADVPPERLERFFIKEPGGYRVKKKLRDLVLFAPHNLLHDPPFSGLDLITCRNLLIYLERAKQQEVLQAFQDVLNPHGLLMLGSSEFADRLPQDFTVVDKAHRIFARRPAISNPPRLPALPSLGGEQSRAGASERAGMQLNVPLVDLHRKLLEAYAPPSVIVNENYEIVHLTERAGRFFHIGGGEPSHNLLKVVRSELQIELRAALYRAVQTGSSAKIEHVPVVIDGQARLVGVMVHPSLDSQVGRGLMLVIFDDAGEADPKTLEQRTAEINAPLVRQLDEELQRTKDQLRATIDQYKTITGKLPASNEELRSATDEREISKEELQSVNEELISVNQELQLNVDELARANSDLQNFLVATDIAIIFVDRGLRIVRYTPPAQALFNFIPADINRPLRHITHQLNYQQLPGDITAVLQQLVPVEREVQHADGIWYMARLRPYRTAEDPIDGVVLTFIDITQRREESAALRALLKRTEQILESISDAYYALDQSYRCTYLNGAAERLFGMARWDLIGKDIRSVFGDQNGEGMLEQLQHVMDKRLMAEFEEYYQPLNIWTEVRVFPTPEGGLTVYQRDISRRKQIEQRLRTSEERLLLMNENIQDYAIIMQDADGRVVDWNVGAERLLGYTSDEMLSHDTRRIFTPEDVANGVPEAEMQTALVEGRAIDERWHMGKDGARLWLSGVMTALRDEAGALRGFAKVARDRTDRVLAEEALRASEEHLRIALDAAHMGTWSWNLVTGSIEWSEQHYRMFGITDPKLEITQANLYEYVYPDDRAVMRRAIEQAIEHGRDFKLEYRIVRPDGSLRWIASEGRVSRDTAGAALRLNGVIADVTDRKLAERELRRMHDVLEERIAERTHELARANAALHSEVAERERAEQGRKELLRQLVTAEEEERKRISRELHDQMGQQVTALQLGLQAIKQASRSQQALRPILAQMQAVVDNLGREVHQLALQLRPPSLDDLGLPVALANEAAEWSQRTNTVVAFHSSELDPARLPPLVETAVFRVVLEALTNAIKHAQCKQISIILERRDNHVVAIVEDDGVGFDAEAMMSGPRQGHGLGLLGMQERVAQVGGTLTIESAPGSGTAIFIRVPLNTTVEEASHE